MVQPTSMASPWRAHYQDSLTDFRVWRGSQAAGPPEDLIKRMTVIFFPSLDSPTGSSPHPAFLSLTNIKPIDPSHSWGTNL